MRRTVVSVSLLLVACAAGWTAPPVSAAPLPFRSGTVHRDLTYCHGQTLDLYVPRTSPAQPVPVAVFVHGGGMTAGDKSYLNPVFLDTLASAGYAVASLDYRLAPRSKFPAQIEDVKCAIRYLRQGGSRFGVDGGSIFIFGTSVGGQLAALAALTDEPSAFDVGAYRGVSSGVLAAADFFGPANLLQRASGFTPSGIRDVFVHRRDVVLASPTHYVTGHGAPILLVHGVEDTKVRASQSVELYDDLTAAGMTARLLLVRHMGHMFVQVGNSPIDPSLREQAGQLVAFFDAARGG